jgi:hypothetical protein
MQEARAVNEEGSEQEGKPVAVRSQPRFRVAPDGHVYRRASKPPSRADERNERHEVAG